MPFSTVHKGVAWARGSLVHQVVQKHNLAKLFVIHATKGF